MPREEEEPFALKLLFVCSRNRRRSLTAEMHFSGLPCLEVRSAGTQPSARVVVNEGHVKWADIIFAMEKSHLAKLHRKFGDALDGKCLITLHIPDDYETMQDELIDELEAKVGEHVDLTLHH
jgi:predicted protein tyrosine phosphatase